jgi:hypothetical protein
MAKFAHMGADKMTRGRILHKARNSIVNRSIMICVALFMVSYFGIYSYRVQYSSIYRAVANVTGGPAMGMHFDAVKQGAIAFAFKNPGGTTGAVTKRMFGYDFTLLRTDDGRICRAFRREGSGARPTTQDGNTYGLLFLPRAGHFFWFFRDGNKHDESLMMFLGTWEETRSFVTSLRFFQATILVSSILFLFSLLNGLVREVRWLRLDR